MSGVLAIGAGVVTVTAQAGPAAAAPLNGCVNPDNGDPLLTSVDLSPATVDVTGGPAQLTITATGDDTGGPGPATGLRRFTVAVADPTDDYNVVRMTRTPAGDWIGTLTVRKWARPGTWDIAQVVMEDRIGQHTIYNRTGEEEKDLSLVPGTHATSVKSVVDRTPPELRSFTLPAHVDTRRRNFVRINARIRDDQTGVAVAAAWVGRPGRRPRGVALHPVPGTAHQYRGRLLLDRWVPSGTWRVQAVVLGNANNRYRFVGYRALGQLGFSRDLEVTSRRDRAAPTITAFRSPDTVDVRVHDQVVTVRARAHDIGSGVRSVTASFSGPRFAVADVELHRVSGTKHHGVWRGITTFRTCTAASAVWNSSVQVTDRAGRRSFYWSREPTAEGWPRSLRVTGRPHVAPPRANVNPEVVPAGPVVVRFGRAVNGISATSATVRQWSPDSPAPPGPVLDGSWTCRDAAGVVIGCATGHVRRADFHPVAALDADQDYLVELNPEHSLEVTDLDGNPYDRDQLFFP